MLSPSSRRRDVGDKLTAYRDAGVPSYWVVDPINPRLRAWELRDGEYVEIADVAGDREWTAEAPYPVTVRPADLLRVALSRTLARDHRLQAVARDGRSLARRQRGSGDVRPMTC